MCVEQDGLGLFEIFRVFYEIKSLWRDRGIAARPIQVELRPFF